MADPRCGTVAGHAAHRYRREQPCDRCKAAKKLYDQQRREQPISQRIDGTRELAQIVIEKRPAWRNEAACVPLVATWDDAEPHDQIAVCRRCPVARQCLAYGFTTHSVGIVFGGVLLNDWPMEARRWMRLDNNLARRTRDA